MHYEEWKNARSEIMYWRKANQIHNWFVINVQNKLDDCGNYEVTKEALETLLEQCKLVEEEFKKAKEVEGMVKKRINLEKRNRSLGRYYGKRNRI